MRYLLRLVTPPGGITLDPFAGSGSSGKAAMIEGFRFIGIDLNKQYIQIAYSRLEHAIRELAPKEAAHSAAESNQTQK